MAALRHKVVREALDEVQIAYLDRETARWWNERRDQDDTPTFCGWYWIKGREEGGPFKSRSSAIRDAYYTFVLRREAPNVGRALTPRGRRKQARELARAAA